MYDIMSIFVYFRDGLPKYTLFRVLSKEVSNVAEVSHDALSAHFSV